MERQPTTEPTTELTTEPPDEDTRDVAIETLFRDIERSGVLPPGIPAFDAADTVLCALAMRLPRADAEDLADVVPPTLRSIISRCVLHEDELPELSLDLMSFLRLIATRLGILTEDAKRVARAVFVAVQRLVPEDEIWDVRNRLPRELDVLWYPYNQTNRAPFEPVGDLAALVGVAADASEPQGARPFEEPTESILRELEQSGVLPGGTSALDAIGAVLCTVGRELTGAEARELAALTPRTLRGLLDRCLRHRGERPETFDQAAFLAQIAEHLGIETLAADRVSRAVFAALRSRLPAAEVAKMDNRLPRSVRALWALR